jgi:hypothetical protein
MSTPQYDAQGYDADGYDADGYDRMGVDRQGYDRTGRYTLDDEYDRNQERYEDRNAE